VTPIANRHRKAKGRTPQHLFLLTRAGAGSRMHPRITGENVVQRLASWCCLIAYALLGALAQAYAQGAQSYPDRPIRLIVAFSPGGATDVMTRQIADDLKAALGQPVVVENRPGANGFIAWSYIASSDPDGYTLLMAENALAISPGLYKRPFDPVKQLDAVAFVATSPLVLVVGKDVKANNVAEFVALSRATKSTTFSSAGIGSVAHLTFEAFKAGAGMEAMHVPYKGGGQAIGDVVAGHIDANMAAISVGKSMIEGGKVKGLVVTSRERSPVLPDVPTLKEAGINTADVELSFWWGIFAPAGLPDAVRAKLDKAVSTVTSDSRVRERLAKLDIEPAYAPADVLKARLVNDVANWSRFIAEHEIKAE
jgi:tripartite-type tricarboxylate transporter receptor subunit TctC